MADLKDPSQPPRKHKVIHWNPEEEEGQLNKAPAFKAYLGGAVAALFMVLVIGAGYFLFLYEEPNDTVINAASNNLLADPNQAFKSGALADGVKNRVERSLEAIQQMPTAGNDVLTQMLINIEKENLEAEKFMDRRAYARAIDQYNVVDSMIKEFTSEVENKQRAQNLYDSFLVKSEELEFGKHLNQEKYDEAFQSASEGSAFLETGSFTPALQRLEEASAQLDEVQVSIKEFIRSNAAKGHRFIAQGKGEEAIAAFEAILEIDPDNEDAIKMKDRAAVANRVFGLLQEASQKEKGEDLEGALALFQEAFSIDSQSAKAQSGIARVRSKIEERDFNYYYGVATSAESDGRYETAIENYELALKIFPKRTDIETAIEKAIAEKHQNDIVSRITRAYDYERQFAWEEARDLYKELVNMEPDLQEAKDGLLRAGRMIRSILRYEKLLEVAKSEAKRAEFQLAIRTFDKAMQSKPAYLELTPEGERLREFLRLQSQPVPVVFISDEATWVSVQGPSQRKPEKVREATYNLMPGEYFVIGRKKGYRDVRMKLSIRAGRSQPPVTVICDRKNDF